MENSAAPVPNYRHPDFRRAVGITLLFVASGFGLAYFNMIGYAYALFVFLPLATGLSVGMLRNAEAARSGLGWALALFFFILIICLLEGFICVVLSIPIVLLFVGLGLILAKQIKKYQLPDKNDSPAVLLLPYLVFLLGAGFEKNTLSGGGIDTVQTEIILPYAPQQVYEAIKSVDTLDAEKPLLLSIGLPVPQKCVLESEQVGALRTCYFEGGQIVERVTALEPGRLLRMDVIDYGVLGLKWLHFKEAVYTFEALPDGQTKMIRYTTYSSDLQPRPYWKPLETLGIRQEHDYVIRNLQKDLRQKH